MIFTYFDLSPISQVIYHHFILNNTALCHIWLVVVEWFLEFY